MQVGANPGRARSHNRQLVLGEVRSAGEIGRAEIARRSGLSTQAVSNIISDLLDEGMLRKGGKVSAGRGLPVQRYALEPGGGYAYGAEIRTNQLLGCITDLAGTPIFTERRTLSSTETRALSGALRASLAMGLEETGISKAMLLGGGVVLPGPFGRTGMTDDLTTLVDWHDDDPAATFGEALDLPVTVENDANAGAMAERMTGRARDLDSYAYLYFGQGLGLGIVQDGALLRGGFGNAGEIGALPVIVDGQPAPLEQHVSRVALRREMASHGLEAGTIDDIAALVAEGGPQIDGWLDQAAGLLSQAVFVIETLFDPQSVLIGGAMPAEAVDTMIERIALSDKSISARGDRSHSRLQRAICGRMTTPLGAASLVLNHAFTPSITAGR